MLFADDDPASLRCVCRLRKRCRESGSNQRDFQMFKYFLHSLITEENLFGDTSVFVGESSRRNTSAKAAPLLTDFQYCSLSQRYFRAWNGTRSLLRCGVRRK